MEENPGLIEYGNLLNEAWTNGYIDGYISVVRDVSGYHEHLEGYVGSVLEEYEAGYLSAIQDDVKWTRKYAWARGYTDGFKASSLEWSDFGYFAFWMPEYSGNLLKRYNTGYSVGFMVNYSKKRDYEWALGFVNQLRSPRNQLFGKNYHDDHGYLYYPIAYEEGYETAKTFHQYNTLNDAESCGKFSRSICWAIGFIDGRHNRNKRNDRSSNCFHPIFYECYFEYNDGYEAGVFTYWNRDQELEELEPRPDNKEFVDSFRKQRNEEDIWGIGYIDGKLYGVLRYRGYKDAENDIYNIGYKIGSSERMNEKGSGDLVESVSLLKAEDIGRRDSLNYDFMINHGFDRPRFHAYREGFYKEKEWQFKQTNNLSNSEDITSKLLDYLKSFEAPFGQVYIDDKLSAWKLGVKSGFTGNSDETNRNIFFYSDEKDSLGLDENYSAHNIESYLFESYKEGCRFGFEHTYHYKWNEAYETGYEEGCDSASSGNEVISCSRDKYKGFELEAYDKGFSDGVDSVEKNNKQSDSFYDSADEWTREDVWDAMTDGQYGDYPGGDVDYEKIGF